MSQSRCACAVVLWSLLAPLCAAENWPQWRGPFFNGSTTETGLPAQFSKAENIAWVTPLPGPSSATPIVWGDRAFVSSLDAKTRDLLAICLDASDGKILWARRAGKDRPPLVGGNNMATPSPVTDGRRVFFLYGTGDLAAFDYQGRLLWSRNLENDLGGLFIVKFGYSSSPLLLGGRLYVLLLQNVNPSKYRPSDREGPLPSYLLAIDPETGQDLWRHVRPSNAFDESLEAYVTPIPFTCQGRTEIVIPGGDAVTGHDTATGQELWRWRYNPERLNLWRLIPSVVPGDGLIYFVLARANPLYAIRGGGRGTLTDADIAWSFMGPTTDADTPLCYGGRLYVLEGDKKILTCLDAKTGEKKWQAPLGEGSVLRGSPTGADGKVYCITEGGQVIVLAAGDEFQVLSRTTLGEGPCRSSIAVAGGRLFIRTARSLYCVASSAR
jgi:outer membrane protein assembly factor BamB